MLSMFFVCAAVHYASTITDSQSLTPFIYIVVAVENGVIGLFLTTVMGRLLQSITLVD